MNNVYVIRKNSAILKCSIPSFVADFVTVVSWHDDEEGSYYMDESKATKGIANSLCLLFKTPIPYHNSE